MEEEEEEEEDWELLPLPQLREKIQEERHANELLQIEVEILEKQCRKMGLCSSPLQLSSEIPYAAQAQTQACGGHSSRLHSTMDSSIGLTLEQKYKLLEQEVAEVKDEIRRINEDCEKTVKNLQASIKAADAWWADTKKARSEFENFVSTISSKDSEKLLRYMEEKNRQRDLLRERLHIKTCMLRAYKKKLEEQIRKREKMRGTVTEAQLQELRVTNAWLQKESDAKRQKLQQLKVDSRKLAQLLHSYQKRLQDAMESSASLKKTISQKKQQLEKVEKEIAVVEEERAKAAAVNQQLRKQLSEHSAPSVLTYMKTNMAVADLKAQVKAWERKVAVAKMSLQSHCRASNQTKKSANQH